MAAPDLMISNSVAPAVQQQVSTAISGSRKAAVQQSDLKATQVPADGWVKIDRSKFAFSQYQASASSLNSVARSIRVADSSMQKIGKAISEMKAKVQVHLKTFPPYPPGSQARVKLLKSFAAFRRLIEELTIPPDDSDAAKIMGSPLDGTKNPSALVAEHNGFAKTIQRQPVHPGLGGLDIPELGKQADDQDLAAAVARLDAAARTLDSRRNGLLADATAVFNPPNL